MTAMIRTFYLNPVAGKQAIDMPKRARVLYVYPLNGKIAMDVVQDEDADTRAFDTKNQRYFEAVNTGNVCPDGQHLGSCAGSKGGLASHVYEVRGR